VFGNVQQNFDVKLERYEERQKVIDELFEWNKFNKYVDLNDIRNDGRTHEEGISYGKGHYDYGVAIDMKLHMMRGEYKV